jgi:hypothetical protein
MPQAGLACETDDKAESDFWPGKETDKDRDQ